jgi:hypothetical protein
MSKTGARMSKSGTRMSKSGKIGVNKGGEWWDIVVVCDKNERN